MATITSDEGYFQVTACTFTPKVVAVGETVTFSVTIKNVSGKSVSSCYVSMDGRYPSPTASGGYGSYPSIYLYGGPSFAMKSISWGNNVSQTFTGTFTLSKGYYPVDESNYVFPVNSNSRIHISIVTNATFANGGNYSNFNNICGANGENLRVLSKRDNPRLSIDLERYPNDEASTVKATIRITSDCTVEEVMQHGYAITLHASNSHNPALSTDPEVAVNWETASPMSIETHGIIYTDSLNAITQTFSNGTDWYFLLTASNGYETATTYTSVPRAFANVHLSGCTTGGVAFGKFSGATEGNPIFECEYPARFSHGIFDADGNEIGGLKIAAGDPVKIGTFLGRDLYRRVITTSSTGTVLSGFNPYDIVDIYGYVRFSNGVRYRIPFYYDSSHYSRVYVDDSNRVLFTTNGGTVSRAVIVIEYTNQ